MPFLSRRAKRMLKYSIRALALILMIVMCACTVSVYAAWSFATDTPDSTQSGLSIGIIAFEYTPDVILPGDQNATNLHTNHYNLINSIVNHVDYGLNASKKPIIRKLLEDGAGVVYSDQSVSGGNLKHMLLNTSDVEALAFVVQYSTATEFIAYTFVKNEADRDNIGNYITVYKTVIEKKSTRWEATTSYKGEAKVFDPGIVESSIDVTTWRYAA